MHFYKREIKKYVLIEGRLRNASLWKKRPRDIFLYRKDQKMYFNGGKTNSQIN